MKTNNEKKITRTIHFADVIVTVYHKDSKTIEESRLYIPYHGEEIMEHAQRYMPESVKVVDAEITAEFDKLIAVPESVFIQYGTEIN